MASRLEKALQNPDSMKARILAAARRLFGERGYTETTTRLIARTVGIDISTLYYHWGEKRDLYEGVIAAINEEILGQFRQIEQRCRGASLRTRLEIAIDVMCDYLFGHPEVAHLILLAYFRTSEHNVLLDINMDKYIGNIAVAMGLAADREHVSVQARARILALWNAALNFISGQAFFRPMLGIDPAAYEAVVKETLKFILVPAFTSAHDPETLPGAPGD
jgi:AcrR family transcriptional regulator